jgi:hypothetical protein
MPNGVSGGRRNIECAFAYDEATIAFTVCEGFPGIRATGHLFRVAVQRFAEAGGWNLGRAWALR